LASYDAFSQGCRDRFSPRHRLAAVLLVLAGTLGLQGPNGLAVAPGLIAGATFGAGTVLSK
jgi:hypothetical protein